MALTVLIVPDKFKGTLTAQAAAKAMARGWHKARPQDTLELLPMSDGGDGFGEVMSTLLGAKIQHLKTVDAAHRPCSSQWWWESKSKTAIIETANIIGLAMLPPKKFHPFVLDTYGIGAVLQAARAKGAKNCLMGIGGSATNDGGFGVARAMGCRFLDKAGSEITNWTELHTLNEIVPPARQRWFDKLIVAVDVQNSLLGKKGCSRIYGPQKGLLPADFPVAEKNLRRMAKLMTARDYAGAPGAGAAGGLGFGLSCFLGAELQPGFELFARHANLARRLKSVDLVITGEGSIDLSTLMGKGVGQVAQECSRAKIPCLGLAGVARIKAAKKNYFTQVNGLTDLTTTEKAMSQPALWLEKLAEKTAEEWPENVAA